MQRTSRIALGATTALVAVATPLALFALPATAGRVKTTPTTVVLPTTATYSYSATLTGLPGTTSPVNITGAIDANLAAGQVEVTATLPTAIGPIGPGTLTVIEANQTLYVNAPGLSGITGGRSWLSFSEPASVHALGQLGSTKSPAAIVGNVPAVIAAITTKPAGHPVATVTSTSTSGANTTTNLLIHLPQLHRHLPAAAGSTTLPTSIPVSVTDDAAGRLQGASISVTVASATLSASLTSTGYNVPVSISVPASSDVLVIPTSMLATLGALLNHGSGSSVFHAAGGDLSTLAHNAIHGLEAKFGL